MRDKLIQSNLKFSIYLVQTIHLLDVHKIQGLITLPKMVYCLEIHLRSFPADSFIINQSNMSGFIISLNLIEFYYINQKMQKSASNKANMVKKKASSLKKTEVQSRREELNSADLDSQSEIPPPAPGRSENVRVAIRIRPMNQTEISRGDSQCLTAQNENTLVIAQKGSQKGYQFNYVLGPSENQRACYQRCCVDQLIEAAIEGYSATVFAYGQTGSGKTYTMAGKEEIFSRQVYKQDQREGIIPRAIQELWRRIRQKKGTYSVKASFTEIYNEQIKDLLNLSSGVLHCRWNPANGFFVQDLIVVDCSNVDDMISVLLQGMKNRRSGSHQMNKDSSRSHSIMTIYIISQAVQGVKRYGKMSFVDLAGSQRLKESKSQGEMIKETGNINKSLFALGKVIKGLTDRKSKTPYIPYRDSKLTMLLMDSLGGNSKALMIACASPSAIYFDETLSTLNYAARTMNIRNRPMVQMDQKDQLIQEIQAEIDELKRQNLYLREQYQRLNKGLPIRMPQLTKQDLMKTSKLQVSLSSQLPPLQKNINSAKGEPRLLKSSTDSVISQYQLRFQQIKKENQVMRKQKDQSQQNYKRLMDTNNSIQSKLENLQQIFLNNKRENSTEDQVVTSSLLAQNTQLKRRLRDLEQQRRQIGYDKNRETANITLPRAQNQQLQRQIQRLQARQHQLLEELQRKR